MSTRAEYIAAVKEDFRRDDKDDIIGRKLNDTYKEMVAIIQPRKTYRQEYRNTVAKREEYALPSHLLRLSHPIRLLDPDGNSTGGGHRNLEFITKEEYDRIEPYPNISDQTKIVTGIPWAYTIYQNSILLTDIPHKVYTLEINMGGYAVELVEPADESVFHAQFDETIRAGTLARMFHHLGMVKTAATWQNVYENGYVSEDGPMVGGLNLIRQIEREQKTPPLIIEYNDY